MSGHTLTLRSERNYRGRNIVELRDIESTMVTIFYGYPDELDMLGTRLHELADEARLRDYTP